MEPRKARWVEIPKMQKTSSFFIFLFFFSFLSHVFRILGFCWVFVTFSWFFGRTCCETQEVHGKSTENDEKWIEMMKNGEWLIKIRKTNDKKMKNKWKINREWKKNDKKMIKKWKNGAKKSQMSWNPINAKNLEFFHLFIIFFSFLSHVFRILGFCWVFVTFSWFFGRTCCETQEVHGKSTENDEKWIEMMKNGEWLIKIRKTNDKKMKNKWKINREWKKNDKKKW